MFEMVMRDLHPNSFHPTGRNDCQNEFIASEEKECVYVEEEAEAIFDHLGHSHTKSEIYLQWTLGIDVTS